ncbi:MAG: DUF4331 family protein [Steroidobacter sp.]
MAACVSNAVIAANHLDTPTVIAEPRADIGDLFAWMSPDARRLNLVMDIVGRSFSDQLSYVFHVDSGRRFGKTTQTITIECRFTEAQIVDCKAGDFDRATGDASQLAGLASGKGRFKVFAGPRDDPFFNNVKGPRAGYQAAAEALANGTTRDAASCPQFSAADSERIKHEWRSTSGGPGTNFLAGWRTSALVISIDVDAVAKGGKLLAVWGATTNASKQLDRMGRPLTTNALLATLGPEQVAIDLKERYNLATPATADEFVPEIETGLALYDGFDGVCGNQWLADRSRSPANRYRTLARVMADDRLWINSSSGQCREYFAVELDPKTTDCGGRTPLEDAVDVYRAVLVNGTTAGFEDGVDRDDREHSLEHFPFLAAPAATDEKGAYR